MKALTIRQPWASAIAIGPKRTENRMFKVALRGPFAIHAGLSADWNAPGHAWLAAGMDPATRGTEAEFTPPLGAVIAVADITGCHYAKAGCGCREWGMPGQWHWLLGAVRPLAAPVACSGSRGWWTLPDDVESAVLAQLGEK